MVPPGILVGCFVALTEGHVVQVVALGQTPGSVAGVCVVGVAQSGTD